MCVCVKFAMPLLGLYLSDCAFIPHFPLQFETAVQAHIHARIFSLCLTKKKRG